MLIDGYLFDVSWVNSSWWLKCWNTWGFQYWRPFSSGCFQLKICLAVAKHQTEPPMNHRQRDIWETYVKFNLRTWPLSLLNFRFQQQNNKKKQVNLVGYHLLVVDVSTPSSWSDFIWALRFQTMVDLRPTVIHVLREWRTVEKRKVSFIGHHEAKKNMAMSVSSNLSRTQVSPLYSLAVLVSIPIGSSSSA